MNKRIMKDRPTYNNLPLEYRMALVIILSDMLLDFPDPIKEEFVVAINAFTDDRFLETGYPKDAFCRKFSKIWRDEYSSLELCHFLIYELCMSVGINDEVSPDGRYSNETFAAYIKRDRLVSVLELQLK